MNCTKFFKGVEDPFPRWRPTDQAMGWIMFFSQNVLLGVFLWVFLVPDYISNVKIVIPNFLQPQMTHTKMAAGRPNSNVDVARWVSRLIRYGS